MTQTTHTPPTSSTPQTPSTPQPAASTQTSAGAPAGSTPATSYSVPAPSGYSSPASPTPLSYAASARHQRRAHQVIPGAAHTYAKGDDQYPEGMAPVIVRGQGAHVFDLDGNDLIEYGSGVRSVTLGHGYKPVCDAAARTMCDGTNFARPAAIELAAAEKMLELLPRAEMIKFGKNGSDAVSGAVKIARAYTGRERVAVCGDQPFFSVDNWFIGTTPMASGIPSSEKSRTHAFRHNDLASVQALFDAYPGEIAAVVTEAQTHEPPPPTYLHDLQELCHRNGALMVLDETITGFRWHNGGAQGLFDFTPDLSTFGKAMANGFAVSALLGRREYMRLAGTEQTDRERCFVLSLTHGAETHALAACMATIQTYQTRDVIGEMVRQGDRLRRGVEAVIAQTHTGDYFHTFGRSCLLLFATLDPAGQRSQPYRTLFMQEMLKHGIIAPNFVVGAAHTNDDIDRTIEATRESLIVYRRAIDEGVEKYLVGRPVKPVFRSRN